METRIVETPIEKHRVEIKQYLTALDYRQIQKGSIGSDVKYEVSPEEVEAMKTTGKFELKLVDAIKMAIAEEDAKIVNVVVSVDGNQENILDRILNFRKEDFDFVMAEINKVIEGDKKKS